VEEADDLESRGLPHAESGRRLVVLALALFLVALGMFAYYFTLPQYTGPRCWGFHDHPSAMISASPVVGGYVFSLVSTSHVKPLDCYAVSVYKDGEPFWYSEPPSSAFPITHKEVVDGYIGEGPTGEILSFSDSDGNGRLSAGDTFTLESMERGTEYGFYLLTERSDMIVRMLVEIP